MARLLLAMGSHDRVQRRALKLLAKRPEIFQSLLAFHVGAEFRRDLFPNLGFGFGKQVPVPRS